jgi:hypothetical protein
MVDTNLTGIERSHTVFEIKDEILKLFLKEAIEARYVVRRRGSHSFVDNGLTDGSEVVSILHSERFLILVCWNMTLFKKPLLISGTDVFV